MCYTRSSRKESPSESRSLSGLHQRPCTCAACAPKGHKHGLDCMNSLTGQPPHPLATMLDSAHCQLQGTNTGSASSSLSVSERYRRLLDQYHRWRPQAASLLVPSGTRGWEWHLYQPMLHPRPSHAGGCESPPVQETEMVSSIQLFASTTTHCTLILAKCMTSNRCLGFIAHRAARGVNQHGPEHPVELD